MGQNWLLQTLSDVFNEQEQNGVEGSTVEIRHHSRSKLTKARQKAQREWCGAIAALESLLLISDNQCRGLILSAPGTVLSTHTLLNRFETSIFTPKAFNPLALMPATKQTNPPLTPTITQLPLLPNDPIAEELFCLTFTSSFSLTMVLGEDYQGIPAFQFSFCPETNQQIWKTLRSRLVVTNHPQLSHLDEVVAQFFPTTPDYSKVQHFSRHLLKHLPDPPPPLGITEPQPELDIPQQPPEVELLEALSHEIRTPLTTIRTLTRLLLKKRRHLTEKVVQRLESIDGECSEQIDRMELILRAAALSKQEQQVPLSPISLEQVFHQSIPCWRERARRRNVILDVVLPPNLPTVVTDPAMLHQVLTGVMENFTRSLPHGGEIQVEVKTAGDRLKLELVSQSTHESNPFKSLGQLLMFQRSTGCLRLNLDATKNLFHVLGGKLIVRQKPQQGEVFTIFLPLGLP